LRHPRLTGTALLRAWQRTNPNDFDRLLEGFRVLHEGIPPPPAPPPPGTEVTLTGRPSASYRACGDLHVDDTVLDYVLAEALNVYPRRGSGFPVEVDVRVLDDDPSMPR
jgi:hypothetical protein